MTARDASVADLADVAGVIGVASVAGPHAGIAIITVGADHTANTVLAFQTVYTGAGFSHFSSHLDYAYLAVDAAIAGGVTVLAGIAGHITAEAPVAGLVT